MPDAVRQLRPAAGITVRAAADVFLDSIRSPNTRRAYAIAVVRYLLNSSSGQKPVEPMFMCWYLKNGLYGVALNRGESIGSSSLGNLHGDPVRARI